MKPLLYVGPLSGRVYLATRYTQRRDGTISVTTKYDVTSQVGAVLDELDKRGLELRPIPASER